MSWIWMVTKQMRLLNRKRGNFDRISLMGTKRPIFKIMLTEQRNMKKLQNKRRSEKKKLRPNWIKLEVDSQEENMKK